MLLSDVRIKVHIFIEVMGMCTYVRRMAGGKFNDHCVMKSVRIMIWKCMHSIGVGFVFDVEESLMGMLTLICLGTI